MKGPPRRSSSVLEGRDWLCRYCSRSYLSSNSLNNHVRQRHTDEPTFPDFIKAQYKNADEEQKEEQHVVKPNVTFIDCRAEILSTKQSDPLEDFRAVFHDLVQSGSISIPVSLDYKCNFLYRELSDYLVGG